MIFFKLWRHDLRYGLSKCLLLYLLVAFGQAFLFCRGFSNWIGNMSGLPEIGELSDTFGNYMIYLFQGMDEYIATPDKALLHCNFRIEKCNMLQKSLLIEQRAY